MIRLLNDNAQTTLDGAISAIDDILNIDLVAESPTSAPFRIWIGDEAMIVVELLSPSQYRVVRAVENSIALAHLDEDVVFYPLTSGVAVQLAIEIRRRALI